MATLDSFLATPGASLDSFQFQGSAPEINTTPSNKHLAAQVAAISGGDSVAQTYLSISTDLDLSGSSALMQRVQEQAQQEAYQRSQEDVMSVLADPSASDEQRQNVINQYMDANSDRYRLPNIISDKALMEDNGDETYESENARIDLAASVEEVNQSKREIQQILNAEMNKSNPTIASTIGDMLELMTPFGEATQIGRVVRDLKGGDTSAIADGILMMGSTRAELRDSLERMPPKNRAMFAQKIADAINDNDNVLIQDQNDMARLQNLKAALDGSSYGTVDEWVDNAMGWLDIASLGFPLASGAARGIRGMRASRATDRAAEETVSGAFNGTNKSGDEVVEKFGDLSDPEAQPANVSADPLRAEEDASEARLRARREAFENDPVRRGEDAQEARQNVRQARRAQQEGGVDPVRRQEDEATIARLQRENTQRDYDPVRVKENDAEIKRIQKRIQKEDSIQAGRSAELEEYISKQLVRTRVAPSSLSQNYKDVNPTKARAANEVAGASEEGAQALYGTSRVEAVANDELPEIAMSDGSVRNKVSMPDRSVQNPAPASPRILHHMDANGANYLTSAEKASAATRVVNDFNNAVGVVTRKEMNVPSPNDIGNGFDVNVTYGPKDMGWSNGQEAIDLIKHSLRDYAVDERNITLLRKQGSEYRPVDKSQANQDGDFLVQIKYSHKISAKDIEDWDDLDVVNNFLDRMPHLWDKSGSLQRHLLDAASMLNPTLIKGASTSVARGAGLEKVILQQIKDFGDKLGKLTKAKQSLVNQVIKQQNLHSRVLNDAELKALGMADAEKEVLRAWKEIWDNMYWLENQDMVKTLRNRGHSVLEHQGTNSRLFGRKVARNQVGDSRKAYDLEQGRFVTLDDQMLKELYDEDGHLFELRQPIDNGGEPINRVIALNKLGRPATRGLRDDDRILNYREGYYTVQYTAPKFVEKIVRDAQGNELYRKAVATAGDTKEAELYASRMRKSDGGEYEVRNNVKKMELDSDDNWSLQVASGRTAQRIRGERLEDANSPVLNAAANHLMGPVDSAIVAARSVATRVSMRDYLESSKARAIAQYGELFPKNKYGQPEFPKSSRDIRTRGNNATKKAADARTTVEYINYLENGYVNGMDTFIKAGLSTLADVLGTRGLSRSERLVRSASEHANPTAIGKNLSFTLYLALNPARQFLVQSHQAVQLAALAPRYVVNGLANDMTALTTAVLSKGNPPPDYVLKLLGRSKEEVREMYDAFESSGILAQVDKQNLVRGSLTQMAEDSRIGGRKNPISRAIGGVRSIGFDAGENVNQMTAFLTFFHRAKQANGGKKLSKTEIDNVTAEAINYTYNMNRAGDMPYNENSLALMFQFMQVPHKALTQMISNRILTGWEKARIAAFNGLWYGAPTSGITYAAFGDLFPEDGEWREVMTQGLESYVLNKLLTKLSGQETEIDFQSSLLPGDAKGLYEFATDLMTTDIGTIMASTPAGGLFFGNNARITNFVQSAAEMFNFVEPVDPMANTGEEFLRSVAELASGSSNILKARMIKNHQQVISSSGDVIDTEVSTPEVYAQLFGMQPADVEKYWQVTTDAYKASEDWEKDLRNWYGNLKRTLTREGITRDEMEYYKRVNNAIAQVYGGDTAALRFLRQQMKYDIESGDISLQETIVRQAGFDPQGARELVLKAPLTDENKQALLDRIEIFDRAAASGDK
tara:strand:+ start:44541 stop:49595 length:5055 start_codon:yes stop_codon:yes gene_type:complete